MKNLDLLSAQGAQRIIKNTEQKKATASDVENLSTKSLGILQENGVYAAMLYLYSRSNDKEKLIASQIRVILLSLIAELGLTPLYQDNSKIVLESLTENICNDIDRLLLVKQLWEQTLIYARYGAKALTSAEG